MKQYGHSGRCDVISVMLDDVNSGDGSMGNRCLMTQVVDDWIAGRSQHLHARRCRSGATLMDAVFRGAQGMHSASILTPRFTEARAELRNTFFQPPVVFLNQKHNKGFADRAFAKSCPLEMRLCDDQPAAAATSFIMRGVVNSRNR